MTFDLDPSTQEARARARAAVAALAAGAADIDRAAAIPAAARQQARAALAPSPALARVVAIEELAAVSGSLAVDAALAVDGEAASGETAAWTGLRGVAAGLASAPRDAAADLAVAAVLVGLGRGALDAGLAVLRETRVDGAKPEQLHWSLADAATELDAARLLLWRAATSGASAREADAAVAMARLQSRAAAEACVAATRRALGAAAAQGSVDRIARDVATTALVFGGADAEETAIAAGVLPAIG